MDKAHVESAGISPSFPGAQPEAVQVMQDLFGIDISQHATRNIIDLEVDRFDWIIVLDPYVYEAVKTKYRWASNLLHMWDIDDPFGKNVEDYKKCARLIQHYIQKSL
jgi:protein-tyrosine-phosphatase